MTEKSVLLMLFLCFAFRNDITEHAVDVCLWCRWNTYKKEHVVYVVLWCSYKHDRKAHARYACYMICIAMRMTEEMCFVRLFYNVYWQMTETSMHCMLLISVGHYGLLHCILVSDMCYKRNRKHIKRILVSVLFEWKA